MNRMAILKQTMEYAENKVEMWAVSARGTKIEGN